MNPTALGVACEGSFQSYSLGGSLRSRHVSGCPKDACSVSPPPPSLAVEFEVTDLVALTETFEEAPERDAVLARQATNQAGLQGDEGLDGCDGEWHGAATVAPSSRDRTPPAWDPCHSSAVPARSFLRRAP